jgi:hypothetical protein
LHVSSKDFLAKVYPNLLKWESGRDDSPIWDDALARVSITKLSKFERLDVIAVGGAIDTIPSDEEYNKFIFLIDLMKMYNYDEREMYEKFPFKIKDVSFSSMLYVTNKILLHIANILGEDSREISEWISRTGQNFYKYYSIPLNGNSNVSDGLFYDYDLVIGDRIVKRTVSSLSPIYTGLISNEDAEAIVIP